MLPRPHEYAGSFTSALSKAKVRVGERNGASLRKRPCILVQLVDVASCRFVMSYESSSVVTRANDESPATVDFVLQKIETIRAPIAHVNELPTCRQRLRSFGPQQAFTCLAFAFLCIGFRFGNFGAAMQHLIAQADDFSRLRLDCQAVVSDIPREVCHFNQRANTRRSPRWCATSWFPLMTIIPSAHLPPSCWFSSCTLPTIRCSIDSSNGAAKFVYLR